MKKDGQWTILITIKDQYTPESRVRKAENWAVFEVVDVVDPDVHEERHAEDSVDEHDEKEQQSDVEQRREGDGKGEQ